MTKKELKAIADIAVDKNINIVSDELWEDIVFDDQKHVSIASLSPEIRQPNPHQLGLQQDLRRRRAPTRLHGDDQQEGDG